MEIVPAADIYNNPEEYLNKIYEPVDPLKAAKIVDENFTAVIVNGSELAQEPYREPNLRRGEAVADILRETENPEKLAFIGFFGGGTDRDNKFTNRDGTYGPRTEAWVMFESFMNRLRQSGTQYLFTRNEHYNYGPRETFGVLNIKGVNIPIEFDELSGTTDQNFYNIYGPLSQYQPENVVIAAGRVRPNAARAAYIMSRTIMTQPGISAYPQMRDLGISAIEIEEARTSFWKDFKMEGFSGVLKQQDQTERMLYLLAVNQLGGILNMVAKRTYMMSY